MLEGALVEVFSVSCLKILSLSIPDKGQRNVGEDEGATNTPCVGDELLRVLFKDDNYDHWNRDYDAPYSLHNSAVIL